MENGPQKPLRDAKYVMERGSVGETKAREIMRMVGVIRLGDGKNSSVRVDDDDLETWIEAQKVSPEGNEKWQKSISAPGRPTTKRTSSTPTEDASANPRVAEIKTQLLE